jgi:hypothetical protein
MSSGEHHHCNQSNQPAPACGGASDRSAEGLNGRLPLHPAAGEAFAMMLEIRSSIRDVDIPGDIELVC